jgi:asparagine synthetase B (glutamine-hydrolysing)
LPPAHRLAVTARDEGVEQYWRFRRLRPDTDRAPAETAADFLRRLETAVAAECAGLEPAAVAVSLSGGLDSTAVAALAPRGVGAFSWTFEATPEADESRRVEAVATHLGLALQRLPGDGLYPLVDDFGDRFVHPHSPYVNPFAALKSRLYDAARAAGCRRVLVGDGGDALYAAREYWLRDLLASRQPAALHSLVATLRRAGRGDRFARRAVARLLPLGGLRQPLRRALGRHRLPWLTTEGHALLPAEHPSPILPPGPRGGRYELCVGAKHSELESEERRLFALCGVERGNPFWSWPLLEAAMQLPAYWHHRDGTDKPLSRLALRGRLPDGVLHAPRGGLLGSFYLRGIELRRREIRETVFHRPRSDWRRFVRREWVEPYLEATGAIRFGHTILWRVISYELWHRRLAA